MMLMTREELLYFKHQSWPYSSEVPLNTIVLLSVSNENITGIEAATWFPYKQYPNCNKRRNKLNSMVWLDKPQENFLARTNLYPNKLPSDFEGCTITVCNMIEYGNQVITEELHLEKTIVSTVFLALNFKILHSSTDCSVVHGVIPLEYSNLNGKSFPKHSVFTHPHLTVREMWFVPCPKLTTLSGNFVKVFSFPVWLLIAFSLFFIMFVIRKASIILANETDFYKNMLSCFYSMWAILVGTSVTQMPVTSRVRVIFILWVLYSLAISTIFQAFFTSFLIEPTKEKGITTVEEMIKTSTRVQGARITMYTWCLRNVEFCKQVPDAKFSTDWNNTDSKESGNTSFLVTDLEMSFYKKWTTILRNHCPLKVTLNTVKHIMVMKRDFPFYSQVNKVTTALREGGILEQMKKNSLVSQNKTEVNFLQSVFYKQDNGDYYVFNISHLKFAFLMYVFGVCIGLAVFFCEIITYKQRYMFLTNLLPKVTFKSRGFNKK